MVSEFSNQSQFVRQRESQFTADWIQLSFTDPQDTLLELITGSEKHRFFFQIAEQHNKQPLEYYIVSSLHYV